MKYLLLISVLAGCAPDYANSDVKLVGVGYDPEEIGPPSEPSGGVLEYSYVNFAGAGLSLAAMGFSSTDAIGPNMGGYSPPYDAVNAFGYFFSSKIPGAESLGITSPPPENEETCYTAYETSGPLGSFQTVDVGSTVTIGNAAGDEGVVLTRYPTEYPANSQDAYAFYNGFDVFREASSTTLLPGADNNRDNMQKVTYARASYPFGEELTVSFPGAFAPAGAPLASIPVPSASVGDTTIKLPTRLGGVQMAWNGPKYDAWGKSDGTDAANATCLMYRNDPELAPLTPEECLDQDASTDPDIEGQIYTGPWDTTDGNVTFNWTPGDDPDAVMSLSVRFLGAVDLEDPTYQVELVGVPPDNKANTTWDAAAKSGSVPEGSTCPDGTRAPTPCEAGTYWQTDPTLFDSNGNLQPWMRGDPNDHLAEVTCHLKDDGQFVLTSDMVADALTYARAHGAQGALFYLARGYQADMTVPDAMDRYQQRHAITPVKLATRAVDIGRFWYEE